MYNGHSQCLSPVFQYNTVSELHERKSKREECSNCPDMRLSLTAEVRQSTFAPPELETLHVDLSRPRQISLGATRAIKRPDEIDFCGMQAGRSGRNLYVPEYRTTMILTLYRL